ncbi:MAG: type II toxin-antitoxin system RelE/ParE family toxin [Methylobacter sp.]|nr:MAG: type II toxin-antitoxin system RelE/ParE family toxin [Methylobacter sp.]
MEDLAAGRKFYDRQEAGVGDYFFDSLFAEIDSLALYGGIHSIHFGFHRLLAKHFPYAIYYKIIDNKATVFRVLDCRHNPNRLRKVFEEMS